MRALCSVLLVALTSAGCASSNGSHRTEIRAGRTHWSLGPSEAMDAICLLNLLRGDPFYLRFAKDAYDLESVRLGAPERAALAHLGETLRAAGHIPSAQLALVFSASGAETVRDLLEVTRDDARWAAMLDAYRRSPQGDGDDAHDVIAVRADLRHLFDWLLATNFPERWRASQVPKIESTIAQNASRFAAADIVGWNEQVLGHPLNADPVRSDLLAYVRPHGIRVTGWHFLTDISFPTELMIKIAIHELLHPPFARTGELADRLSAFEQDPFFQQILREHDPSFGYTTARGLTEEDCAEAIDVFVSEQHGFLTSPVTHQHVDGASFFREHDYGMHVLAFVIYSRMKRADWKHWPGFEAFLLGLLRDGTLANGTLKDVFEATEGHYAVGALAPKK